MQNLQSDSDRKKSTRTMTQYVLNAARQQGKGLAAVAKDSGISLNTLNEFRCGTMVMGLGDFMSLVSTTRQLRHLSVLRAK